jgi:hypothetical protein
LIKCINLFVTWPLLYCLVSRGEIIRQGWKILRQGDSLVVAANRVDRVHFTLAYLRSCWYE